jgi:hypothetical protein
MQDIVIALISSGATLLVALIGLAGSKKFVRRPLTFGDQNKLINTLKDTLLAQTERIRLLETAYTEQLSIIETRDDEVSDLKRRVSNLEQLTVEQALVISQLQGKRRTVRVTNHEGGEVNKNENNSIQQ